YPEYGRKDELLFVLAYNQYEIGDKAGALRSYQGLIDQFPGSRFVPDAYVQMGEHYFQHDDLARARAAFEKAVAFRLPKVYAFALYKLAWCDYNAHDYREAIAKFEEVIDYSERQAQGPDRDRIQLKNEALKDLVLPFAQTDVVEGASAYFDRKRGKPPRELRSTRRTGWRRARCASWCRTITRKRSRRRTPPRTGSRGTSTGDTWTGSRTARALTTCASTTRKSSTLSRSGTPPRTSTARSPKRIRTESTRRRPPTMRSSRSRRRSPSSRASCAIESWKTARGSTKSGPQAK